MVTKEICNCNVYDDWNIGLRRCPEKMSSLGGPTFKKRHLKTTHPLPSYIELSPIYNNTVSCIFAFGLQHRIKFDGFASLFQLFSLEICKFWVFRLKSTVPIEMGSFLMSSCLSGVNVWLVKSTQQKNLNTKLDLFCKTKKLNNKLYHFFSKTKFKIAVYFGW